MNRITKAGTMFLTIVLFGFALLKYFAGSSTAAIFYFIGAVGFFILFLSYSKKEKDNR